MPGDSVKIILEATDKASAAFETFKNNANGALGSIQSSLSLIKWDALVNLGERAMQAGRQITEFLDIGAKAKQTADAFEAITVAAGVSGSKLIEEMKKASSVFVDETGLMIKAQRGLVEGLDPTQIVKLMESARVAARLMGTDVKDAYDLIMESVISLRTRGLRAAFPMDEAAVFDKYAKSIGATADELSEWGKRQALVNELLSQTKDRFSMLGPLIETEAEKIQKMKSASTEFWTDMSKGGLEATSLIHKFLQQFGLDVAKAMQDEEKEFGAGQEKIKGMFFKTVDDMLAYSQKQGLLTQLKKLIDDLAKPLPNPLKDVTPPEPDWIKNWVKQFDELEHAFTQLGIDSQASLAKIAQNADTYLGVIEAKFQKSKATLVDYKNALGSATAAMQKLVPPDTTQQITDVMIATDKAIKQIAEDDPNRGAKVQALIDQQMKTIKAIEGPTIAEMKAAYNTLKTEGMKVIKETQAWIDNNPVRAGVDVKEFSKTLNDAFDGFKKRVESTSIKINVDTSALGGGGSGMEGWTPGTYSPIGPEGQQVDYNVNFTGTGSSTLPLSEKIKEIIAQFGSLDDAMSGLGAMINFSELSMQFKDLVKQLANVKEVTQFVQSVHTQFPDVNMTWGPGYWLDPKYSSWIEDRTSEIMAQMGIIQMKMLMEILSGFGGSFQTGGTVPRTALYLLHKDEEVRPSNQISTSSGPFIFNISGNDPKGTAREIEKILKYNLHGGLRDAIKSIR
jgi:hypothetical protein